ncbi:MAG: cysteine--tRNA ligase [Candidatus Peribacteraceae bacterium]|nr:cysteine--tRNA ligase [Candidatus Peribacteraceae bacterium]MDD5074879.1 cysteine--tRNA ligase [Candidatus Peribacteraceae bacterium]
MSKEKSSTLRLYNTLTKREEEFHPMKGKHVGMYTCGPTVYGRPHIGNYSSFLMADLLRRWLEVLGYEVRHVKNITDVGHLVADRDEGEDKVEKQAKEEQVDPLAIARKYTEQYLADEKILNMLEPYARPRATETIKEMIEIVQVLLKKGHAYETEDGIYFSVETFPAYGALSGNTLKNLSAGARVEVDEMKKHPADFALWKKCVGNNSMHLLRWSYPAGERISTTGKDEHAGFPGWHIECSAMSRKFLGEQIDIHTGGEDNIFPHHECEIAQSESGSGKKPFVHTWVHRRRINLGEEKMSKSLGNVFTLSDILDKGYGAQDLRYYLLSVHYRTNLKFTWKGLDDAKKARRKITEWMEEIRKWESKEGKEGNECKESRQKFFDAMNADLNTPAALAVLFDAAAWSRNVKQWSQEGLAALQSFAETARATFGCFESGEEEGIPSEVQKLLDARKAARANKDFKESDRLRTEIGKKGYDVKDSVEGQKARKM